MSLDFQHNIGTPETKRIKIDLKMPKSFEDSVILSEHQRTDLIKLCGFSVDDKFKLIYRKKMFRIYLLVEVVSFFQ